MMLGGDTCEGRCSRYRLKRTSRAAPENIFSDSRDYSARSRWQDLILLNNMAFTTQLLIFVARQMAPRH